MGKVVFFVTLVIFIDLFFIMTGQICTGIDDCGIGSTLFINIVNLKNGISTQFFKDLIGDLFKTGTTGLLGLLAGGAAVTLGTIATRSDFILKIGIAAVIAIFTGDFIVIYQYLFPLNPILAVLTMAPLVMLFIVTALDWASGRD